MRHPRLLLAAATLLAACLPAGCALDEDPGALDAPETSLATLEQPAIYGVDDRLDYHEHDDEATRALTRASIVALMSDASLDRADPLDVKVRSATLGQSRGLCEDQRFRDQPTAASCSGTLIDDDLVLTAGHCVENQATCEGTLIVFNYYYEAPGELATITTDDIFKCRRLVANGFDVDDDREGQDWAIIQLDRAATPRHAPAALRPALSALESAQALTMVGFGSGLPAKLDTGGRVVDARAEQLDQFTATVDAFGGNSGSGVFERVSDGLRLVGILVEGANDYEDRGDCSVVSEYPADGAGGGEVCTYANRALEVLCDRISWPSSDVCDIPAVCGDGVCSEAEGETPCNCPGDCSNPNYVCPVPENWSCNPSYYAAGDECDCNCGGWDPDCNNPTLRVVGCNAGTTCMRYNGEGCSDVDAYCSDAPPKVIPDGWTCQPCYYDAGDDCDCNCGVYDPDCDLEGARVYGCPVLSTCEPDATCSGGGLPAEWLCDPSYYAAGDDCDCNCGAYDPDCDDPSLSLYGCDAGALGCDMSGACILEEGPLDGGGGGDDCAILDPRGAAPRAPWSWALAALIGLMWWGGARRRGPRA